MTDTRLTKFTHLDGSPVLRRNLIHEVPSNGHAGRIEIITGDSAVELIREIVRGWPAPLAILYVLIVARSELEPARYQSPWLDNVDTVLSFLDRFKDFFEQDARHAIWVASPDHGLQVIYDRHEILKFYGDSKGVREALHQRGFEVGKATVPVPHAHRYHQEFDTDFRALMEWWAWSAPPLQPGDER